MMHPTVSHSMRTSRHTAVLSMVVASQPTRSSKSQVKYVPARVKGTSSRRTPCAGKQRRRSSALTSRRQAPGARRPGPGAARSRPTGGGRSGPSCRTRTLGRSGGAGGAPPWPPPGRVRTRRDGPRRRAGARGERMRWWRARATVFGSDGVEHYRTYSLGRVTLTKGCLGNRTESAVRRIVDAVRARSVLAAPDGPRCSAGEVSGAAVS